jgi:hypothetical protein
MLKVYTLSFAVGNGLLEKYVNAQAQQQTLRLKTYYKRPMSGDIPTYSSVFLHQGQVADDQCHAAWALHLE